MTTFEAICFVILALVGIGELALIVATLRDDYIGR